MNTSTPRLPNQEAPQASVHNSSAYSSNNLLHTKIESDSMQKNRKYRMKKIANYDGTKRDGCVSWLIQVKSAAKDLSLSLREALLDTADGTVYEVISAASSEMSDKALTEHILETFSDIQTPEDAMRKLRLVRRGLEPIVIYNNRYSVIHLVAYGIDTNVQIIEQVWRTYANTLDKELARSLNKFITYQMDKDEHKREIHNLFDVMEKVKNQPPVRAPEVPERSENVSSTTRPTCLMMTTTVMNHPMMTSLTQISSPRKRMRMTTMVETMTRMYLLTMYFFVYSLICIQEVSLIFIAFATGTNCL